MKEDLQSTIYIALKFEKYMKLMRTGIEEPVFGKEGMITLGLEGILNNCPSMTDQLQVFLSEFASQLMLQERELHLYIEELIEAMKRDEEFGLKPVEKMVYFIPEDFLEEDDEEHPKEDGWMFCPISDTEWLWIRFDKNGKPIEEEDDYGEKTEA